jgi:hypothetical protein
MNSTSEKIYSRRISLSLLLIAAFCVNANAISKIYSGIDFPTNRIDHGIQLIEKGKPLLDLGKAPIVAYFDKQDHSLKFTLFGSENPDSVLYDLIPGDQMAVRIATDVSWHEDLQMFSYQYQVSILADSKVPAEMITFRLGFEPDSTLPPTGWDSYQRDGNITFSRFINPKAGSGSVISGFGFRSAGPPKVSIVNIGSTGILLKGAPEGYEDYSLSAVLGEHMGLDCVMLNPAPRPEKIEAPMWIGSVLGSMGILLGNGYLSEEDFYYIVDILTNLQATLRNEGIPSFEVWNAQVNSSLAALTPYKPTIEPEAYSYITENLKYMQRHKDIVWFGKYVPPPEQK